MATESQIPHIAGKITTNQKRLGALTKKDADWVAENPSDALALFAEVVAERRSYKKFGLNFSRAKDIPTPVSFSGLHSFRQGKREGVKIRMVTDEFHRLFLRGKDLTTNDMRQDDASARVYSGRELRPDAKEIAGRTNLNMPLDLAHVWSLLKLASADGNGFLQRNGHPSVILTHSSMGVGFVIINGPGFSLDGWHIDAASFGQPPPLTGLIDYWVNS